MEVENPEVKEIKLDEETNVTMKDRILDSLKNKWSYFRNKLLSLVACTTNTGVNNNNVNNVKEPLVLEEKSEVSLVEQPLSEPAPEVAVIESLPVATPVLLNSL